MSHRARKYQKRQASQNVNRPTEEINITLQEVPSLLGVMKDGDEYRSIVNFIPPNGNVVPDLQSALSEIEKIRQRSVICYLANIVQPLSETTIDLADDLPFNEMVGTAPISNGKVDVMIVTPGGLGQQVSHFVNALRNKFKEVDFILPHMCMSAGTLLVLSGDRIWMDSRSFLGPIDPQVRTNSGELVPAQSILVLLDKIKTEGEAALSKGKSPEWHLIRLLDVMDQRKVGDAINSSEYSIKLASDFLERFKFKHWTVHKNGNPVTPDERKLQALKVAKLLCDNVYWKSHGHGINRDTANREVMLYIDHLESQANLERAVRRFWALMYYVFERTPIKKAFLAKNYVLFRTQKQVDNRSA